MKPPGQLVENKVHVKFVSRTYEHSRTYDLCIDEERRAMGRDCARWQSLAVGNVVTSTVLTIVRR